MQNVFYSFSWPDMPIRALFGTRFKTSNILSSEEIIYPMHFKLLKFFLRGSLKQKNVAIRTRYQNLFFHVISVQLIYMSFIKQRFPAKTRSKLLPLLYQKRRLINLPPLLLKNLTYTFYTPATIYVGSYLHCSAAVNISPNNPLCEKGLLADRSFPLFTLMNSLPSFIAPPIITCSTSPHLTLKTSFPNMHHFINLHNHHSVLRSLSSSLIVMETRIQPGLSKLPRPPCECNTLRCH